MFGSSKGDHLFREAGLAFHIEIHKVRLLHRGAQTGIPEPNDNTLGQTVKILRNKMQKAGKHEVCWRSSGKASGVYFARLSFGKGKQTVTRKLVVF